MNISQKQPTPAKMKEKTTTKKRIKCAVCGKMFTAPSARNKYCSAICREKGRALRRKEWVEKTGFNEKQRENMKLYRKQLAEEKEALRVEKRKQREAGKEEAAPRPKLDKKTAYLLAQLNALEKGGSVSDLFAIAAEYGNTSPEYWEAYKKMVLGWAEAFGKRSEAEVNGISVYREDFGLAVSMSIEELGTAETRT
jgi:hypothetical protein